MFSILFSETQRLLQEVANIQKTYKHRTLSQIAHDIGIAKFSDDTEDQENIEKGHQTNRQSFQNRSERPRQIFSRPRSNRTSNKFKKARDKETLKIQAINEISENENKTARAEQDINSARSSKPNEKADTETVDSNEAFKTSKSDKMSIELDDVESGITTSRTNDSEKRKRVRKTRQVTSESLLAIDDGGRRARVNKAASNASENEKGEIEDIQKDDVQNETNMSPSNSRKSIDLYST